MSRDRTMSVRIFNRTGKRIREVAFSHRHKSSGEAKKANPSIGDWWWERPLFLNLEANGEVTCLIHFRYGDSRKDWWMLRILDESGNVYDIREIKHMKEIASSELFYYKPKVYDAATGALSNSVTFLGKFYVQDTPAKSKEQGYRGDNKKLSLGTEDLGKHRPMEFTIYEDKVNIRMPRGKNHEYPLIRNRSPMALGAERQIQKGATAPVLLGRQPKVSFCYKYQAKIIATLFGLLSAALSGIFCARKVGKDELYISIIVGAASGLATFFLVNLIYACVLKSGRCCDIWTEAGKDLGGAAKGMEGAFVASRDVLNRGRFTVVDVSFCCSP